MMNSKLLSKLLLFVSFLGFVDASYLTIEHFLNRIPPCTVGGCEAVLTSEFAVIFGVPLALIGVLYYLLVFFLVLKNKNIKILVTLGFLASLGLLALQAFVIHAFCLYCLGSLATSTILFVLSFFYAIQASSERL